MKQLLLIIFFITSTVSHARLTDEQVNFKLDHNKIIITTNKDFHLNEKAPAKMITSLFSKAIKPKKKTKDEIVFELSEGVFAENQKVHLEYFVCDNQNTICEQHKKDFQVKGEELSKLSFADSLLSETEAQAGTSSSEEVKYNRHHFIVDNLKGALEIAKKENKLLLVDFNAVWCPACLRLETEVFGQKLFLRKSKDFIKVSIDMDLEKNKPVAQKYDVNVMPTLIIMDSQGVEFGRLVDFRKTKVLVKELAQIIKNKKSLKTQEELILAANLGDKKAMKNLAMRAFNMSDMKTALTWFKALKEESLFSTASEINVAESEKSPDLKDLYKNAILKYEDTLDSISWRIEYAKVLLESGKEEDKDLSNTLLTKNISLLTKALAEAKFSTKLFKETAQGLFVDFERDELLLKLSETYGTMKNEKLAGETLKKLQDHLSSKNLSAAKTGEVLLAIDYMKEAKMNDLVTSWYKKLMDQHPESDLYPRKLARVYYKEKKLEEALKTALKATSLGNVFSFYNYSLLAQIQNDMKLKAEARTSAQKALEFNEAKSKSNQETVELLQKILL